MKTIFLLQKTEDYTQTKSYCKLIKGEKHKYYRVYKFNTMKKEDITAYDNYKEAYGDFMKVALYLLH